MRQVLLALVASLTVAAALAGAGFGSVGSGRAHADDLNGFGGRVAHVRVAPLWREGASPATPPLHRVACATAAAGDTSACFADSTSR